MLIRQIISSYREGKKVPEYPHEVLRDKSVQEIKDYYSDICFPYLQHIAKEGVERDREQFSIYRGKAAGQMIAGYIIGMIIIYAIAAKLYIWFLKYMFGGI